MSREWLECVECSREYASTEVRYTCGCGSLLSVERAPLTIGRALFDERRAGRAAIDRSGVWRFREGIMTIDAADVITHPEGSTRLYERDGIFFKHEGTRIRKVAT